MASRVASRPLHPEVELASMPKQPPTAETTQAIEELCQWTCEGLESTQRCQLKDSTQRCQLKELQEQFTDIFAAGNEDCTLTSLVQHYTNTGDACPTRLRPRCLPLWGPYPCGGIFRFLFLLSICL